MATSNFLANDLISWYNRINEVRQRPGISIGTIDIPVIQNTIAYSETINLLKEQINSLKSNSYLSLADYAYMDSINIKQNDLISSIQKDAFENTIKSIEGICANKTTQACSDRANYSDCSRHSDDSYRACNDCSDRMRDTDKTDYSDATNKTYSKNTNNQPGGGYNQYSDVCRTTSDSHDTDYAQDSDYSRDGDSSGSCSDNTRYSENSNKCSDTSVCQTYSRVGNSVTTFKA